MTMVERIAKLSDAAEAAGDLRMVEACRLALYEDDADALADCLAVLREAEVESLDVAAWCDSASPGEYLATYWDGERDPGSRCGWPDSALDGIRRRLSRRGLTLRTDDRGLVVVVAEVEADSAAVDRGDAERCTSCGHVQPGQSGQCRECGECSMVSGDEQS